MPKYLCTIKRATGDTEEHLIIAASKQGAAIHIKNNFECKSIEEIKDYEDNREQNPKTHT